MSEESNRDTRKKVEKQLKKLNGEDDKPEPVTQIEYDQDEKRCEHCWQTAFKLAPRVLSGDTTTTHLCTWCEYEMIRKETQGMDQFNHDKERELGLHEIIDMDK